MEECSLSSLDLFMRAPVQKGLVRGEYVEYKPIASLTDATTIKFHYQPTVDDFIDLSQTMIAVKCKVLDEAGQPHAEAVEVGVTNYPLAAMFQQVDCELNGKGVSSSSNLYPHRATIESYMHYGFDSMFSWLRAAGLCVDVRVDALHLMDVTGKRHPEFFTYLANGVSKGKSATFIGQLHLDIMNQDRLLIPQVAVDLRFTRSPQEFVCLAATDTPAEIKAKLVIEDMSVFLLHVNASDSERVALEKQIVTRPVQYPIKRVELRKFNISVGEATFSENNAFMGQLPRRLILALVKDEDASGKLTTDPFYYNHYDINSLSLSVGGRQVPAFTFRPDFSNGVYGAYPAYMFSMMGMGKALHNANNCLSTYAWLHGKTFFAFDLEPHMGGSDCFSPANDGNIRIQIGFAKQTPHAVQLIAYGEFDNTISIDRNRNVFKDYA